MWKSVSVVVPLILMALGPPHPGEALPPPRPESVVRVEEIIIRSFIPEDGTAPCSEPAGKLVAAFDGLVAARYKNPGPTTKTFLAILVVVSDDTWIASQSSSGREVVLGPGEEEVIVFFLGRVGGGVRFSGMARAIADDPMGKFSLSVPFFVRPPCE